MRAWLMGGLWLAACAMATAQSVPGEYQWEEFAKRLKASEAVSAHGPDLMGDQVSLSNGALSFKVTDVAIPGNNSLPVEFSRRYVVKSRKHLISDATLADWELVAPNVNGVFAPDWKNGVTGTSPRCSSWDVPYDPSTQFSSRDFWQGLNIETHQASEELLAIRSTITKPSDGRNHRWVTSGQTMVSCLPTIKNGGGGEGFFAVTSDGTKYWFDHMAQYHEPTSNIQRWQWNSPFGNGILRHYRLERKKNALYATRVEDKFGNYVEYTYTNAWNAPAQLTKITASDGRMISIEYVDGRVSKVKSSGREWGYSYGGTPLGEWSLRSVTLPDSSAWSIDFRAFTDAQIKYYDYPPFNEPIRDCLTTDYPINYGTQFQGVVKHPAGATGVFIVDMQRHGRNQVPVNCDNVETWVGYPPGTGNDPNDDVNLYATAAYSLSLKSKELTGPGQASAKWTYSYVPNDSLFMSPGATWEYPVCTVGNPLDCGKPRCLSDACATSSKTTVAGPNGEWTRYSHGNTYLYNEGKLLKIEKGTGETNVLQTETFTYDLSQADTSTYPANYGSSTRYASDGFQAQFHRPEIKRATAIQGVTLSRTHQAMDKFAHPTKVRRESSLGFYRTEQYSYEENLTKWAIDQVKTVLCLESSQAACSGQAMAELTFDAVTAAPRTYKFFGKPRQTLTYNTDGTVATVADGLGRVTTLSQWKRGIAQHIRFAATPESPAGAVMSAVVNDHGWIAAVTNESNHKTCYEFDLMGRLKKTTHPSESVAGICDTSSWNETSTSFVPIDVAEYGIAAGHWRQTVQTGTGYKVSYFDGQWRPVLVREYDLNNVSGTQRFQRFAYDHAGRVTFEAYPGNTDSLVSGKRTVYDVLGRVTREEADSELGVLATITEYQSGFKKRVNNPLNFATTLSYLVYDEPKEEWLTAIVHPEGAYTDFARDAFGKALSVKRRNASSSLAVTRSYTYNSNQELCRVVEPETGATLTGYDAAGQIKWSAAGLPSTQGCEVTGTSAAVAARRVDRSHDGRGRLLSLSFPDGKGNQAWTYTSDGKPQTVSTANPGLASNSLITFSYYRRGLAKSEVNFIPPNNLATSWAYDRNGHLSSQVYPSGLSVAYAPNALGQPTQAGTYATGVSYHPNGALKSFTYGNGVLHTTAQNARQLPSRSTDCKLAGTCAVANIRLDLSYVYDKVGNVTSITDGEYGRQTRGMSYDGLQRLKTVSSQMFGAATYAYNAVDDLTQVSVGAGSQARDRRYCYNASTRQLASIRAPGSGDECSGALVQSLLYDVQGNIKSQGSQAYVFDFGNRLREATGKEWYAYDGFGHRVQSCETTDCAKWVYSSQGQLVYTHDPRNNKRVDHVYLGSRMVAQRERPLTTETATVKYQHTDLLGTPVAVTDSAKNYLNKFEYEPYGAQVNGTLQDGPGYTGHVQDAATKLTYMQQRYYDPIAGRFLSVDPVTTDGKTGRKFNRYVYGANDPYRFVDPDGLDEIDLLGGPQVGIGDACNAMCKNGKKNFVQIVVCVLCLANDRRPPPPPPKPPVPQKPVPGPKPPGDPKPPGPPGPEPAPGTPSQTPQPSQSKPPSPPPPPPKPELPN